MSSVYLDAFRKRKNEQLASEIDLSEPHGVKKVNQSANSVFLESFRKKKNKFLAAELNIQDAPTAASEDTPSAHSEQKADSPQPAPEERSSDKKTVPEVAETEKPDDAGTSEKKAKTRSSRFKRLPRNSVADGNESQAEGNSPEASRCRGGNRHCCYAR